MCNPETSARGPRRSLTHCDLLSLERAASEAPGRSAAGSAAEVVQLLTWASGFCFRCLMKAQVVVLQLNNKKKICQKDRFVTEAQISLKREKITPHVPNERRDALCTWTRASLAASPGGRRPCPPKACSIWFYRKRRDPDGCVCRPSWTRRPRRPSPPQQRLHGPHRLPTPYSPPRGPNTSSAAKLLPWSLPAGHTAAGPRPCPATSVHEARPATVSAPTSFLCCHPRFAVLPAFWEPRAWGWGPVEKLRALLEIHLARPQQELFWDTGHSQCSWVLAPVKTQRQKLLSRGPRTRTPVFAAGQVGQLGWRRWGGGDGRAGKEGSGRAPGNPWGLRGQESWPPQTSQHGPDPQT